MPICTTCTSFTPYLYTVYESTYNLRLEQCSKCHSFADPYVEHDLLTLLLDLILLKRGVYRHLLYNRGTEPRKSVAGVAESTTRLVNFSQDREQQRWLHVAQLGGTLVLLDAFIRWSHLNPNIPTSVSPWTKTTMIGVLRVFLGCTAETLAFHLGIMISCYITLHLISWVQAWRHSGNVPQQSDIKREFRFSLIPLTLFYSSLTKLFLLFLLTIWRPKPVSHSAESSSSIWQGIFPEGNALMNAFKIFESEQIDREWIIRNVLGGMSAGFGLRVVLDMHPIFTSIIILAGWRLKTSVTGTMSGWVGGSETASEAWRAYSIP